MNQTALREMLAHKLDALNEGRIDASHAQAFGTLALALLGCGFPEKAAVEAEPAMPQQDGMRHYVTAVPNPKDTRNGIPFPSIDGLCHQAWHAFDSVTLLAANGSPIVPNRQTCIEAGIARGLNAGNLGTEYSRWRRYNDFADPRHPHMPSVS